jgi:hypothetical protein
MWGIAILLIFIAWGLFQVENPVIKYVAGIILFVGLVVAFSAAKEATEKG